MATEADPKSEVRTTLQPCEMHREHIPKTHVNQVHHVWPLSEGGPDIADNKVVICPTGHYSVHDLLDHYKMLMGTVPWEILKRYTREERNLAELGWKRMQRREL